MQLIVFVAALINLLSSCSSSAPSRISGASGETVKCAVGRGREYKFVQNRENGFDLYMVARRS